MATCEVWICIDSAGDYACGTDADSAREQYDENVGGLADTDGHRLVKVTLNIPLPVVVELSGTVPADGAASLSVNGG